MNREEHGRATGWLFYASSYESAGDVLERIGRTLQGNDSDFTEEEENFFHNRRESFKITFIVEKL